MKSLIWLIWFWDISWMNCSQMDIDRLFGFGTHCRLVNLKARLRCLYFETPCTRNAQGFVSTKLDHFQIPSWLWHMAGCYGDVTRYIFVPTTSTWHWHGRSWTHDQMRPWVYSSLLKSYYQFSPWHKFTRQIWYHELTKIHMSH